MFIMGGEGILKLSSSIVYYYCVRFIYWKCKVGTYSFRTVGAIAVLSSSYSLYPYTSPWSGQFAQIVLYDEAVFLGCLTFPITFFINKEGNNRVNKILLKQYNFLSFNMLSDSQWLCICAKFLFHSTCIFFYKRAKWEDGDRIVRHNAIAHWLAFIVLVAYFLSCYLQRLITICVTMLLKHLSIGEWVIHYLFVSWT